MVGLTAAGAGVYDAVAEHDGVAGLDQPALDQAISEHTDTNTRLFDPGLTHLGGPIGMTIIASLITIVTVWRWRSRTPLILMLIAVAGSLTMTTVGKAVVGRARPPLGEAVPPYEYAFSFPSGHALNSTVIAGIVAYLFARRLDPLRTEDRRDHRGRWAVAMGLSRVFLGHHWLTDVMFGLLLGATWLALLITAHRLFLTIRRARTAQAWRPARSPTRGALRSRVSGTGSPAVSPYEWGVAARRWPERREPGTLLMWSLAAPSDRHPDDLGPCHRTKSSRRPWTLHAKRVSPARSDGR